MKPLYGCNILMQYFKVPALTLKTGCCPVWWRMPGSDLEVSCWGLPLSSECYQPSTLLCHFDSGSHLPILSYPSILVTLRGVQSPTSSLLLPLPSLSLKRHFVKVIKQGFIQQTGGSNIFVFLQGNQNLRQSQC